MKTICRFSFALLFSAYLPFSFAEQSSIHFVEPMPVVPAKIQSGQEITIQYLIKNQSKKAVAIYPEILDSHGNPTNEIIVRLMTDDADDCGPSGNELSGGEQCAMTYVITGPASIGESIHYKLSVNDAIESPIDFRVTGTTWEITADDNEMVFVAWTLVLDETTDTLYAGTYDYYGKGEVYRLNLNDDRNPMWRRIGRLNKPISSLVIDQETRKLYAGVGLLPAYVYSFDMDDSTEDKERKWEKVGKVSTGTMVGQLVLDSDRRILYASDWSGERGVVRLDLSNENARWELAGANIPGDGSIYGLHLHQSTGVLYAGGHDNGCPVTPAHGVYSLHTHDPNAQWIPVGGNIPSNGNIGPLVSHHETHTTNEKHTLYSGQLGDYTGVFHFDLHTADDESHWHSTSDHSATLPGSGLVQSLWMDEKTIYAGTGWGFCKMGNTGVWAADTRNYQWYQIGTSGFPNNEPTPSMVLDPKTNILYAATFSGVYKIQQ